MLLMTDPENSRHNSQYDNGNCCYSVNLAVIGGLVITHGHAPANKTNKTVPPN